MGFLVDKNTLHFQNSNRSTLLDHTSEIAHGAKHLLPDRACLTSFIHTFTHSLFIGAITASTVPESLCASFLLWSILCTKPSWDIDPSVFLTRRIRHWSFTPFKCILAFPMIFTLCFSRSNFPPPQKDCDCHVKWSAKRRKWKVNYKLYSLKHW